MPGLVMNDDFIQSLESSTGDVNRSRALPPACYTDRGFFAFEKEAVFNHEWLCVGRESWAAKPGDYFTTSHIDEPIVVVRDTQGVLRALSTVCQHRAMLVVEGHGNARAFTCPYHHWSYALDGRLIGAPAMERACDFDPKAIRLGELKVEVWLGFVFVNFDREAPALAPRLKELTAALDHYDLALLEGPGIPEETVKCPWNWKVQLENSNDGYHANRLHKGPIHDMCPSDLASFPELSPDAAGYFRFNELTHLDAAFNPTRKTILPIFPRLTEAERKRFLFAVIPPTFQLFCRQDWVSFTIFHALGPEEMSFARNWLVMPGAMREPFFSERMEIYLATSDVNGKQDRWVDTLVQVGLRSRFAARGRYSWQEQAQRDLNEWLVKRYRDAWRRMRA